MQTKNRRIKGGKRGLATVTAIALLGIVTSVWEGRSLTPYKDVVGVWTVCEGETRVEMRRYTEEECDELSKKMYREFLASVQAQLPGVEQWPYMHAAHADISINIGQAAFARSSMRRHYLNGDYRESCRAHLLYNKAGGRVWRGLDLRRKGDASRIGSYELCLVDAVRMDLTGFKP